MTRKTSIDVYRRIEAEGLLSKRRFEIYKVLFENGPLTTNEIFKIDVVYTTINQPNIHARLSELREIGAVEEVGEKICSVTNNTVILWDVTDNIPRKFDKTNELSSKDAAKIAIKFLTFMKNKHREIIANYPDKEKLGKLWKFCQKKVEK